MDGGKQFTIELTKREIDAVLDALYWQSVEVVYDDRDTARRLYRRLKNLKKG